MCMRIGVSLQNIRCRTVKTQSWRGGIRTTAHRFPSIQPGLDWVEILRRIEVQPYHWPISRIGFQTMAYVATREGLPTGFRYERGSFGPFSKDLKKRGDEVG